ncbi:endolytic transglycosylase MltG [Lysinibacillus sp. 2017]|uniref:endolytic transglycosylase MltG n=1 Tax=unclassified Lysinibacillus TaxID=2636778 RepID=UPI000D526CD9|nr:MULTISPECIES: endolytic transglycosylase MltG [unclassified Lysinibacillus]AWE08135.1 endolytic transglycosylase MltG [Lysinibacillus sp. 2017]TGN36361.1 endolytic transglycosylase MltG [Lysinibacillus sp. S2017]
MLDEEKKQEMFKKMKDRKGEIRTVRRVVSIIAVVALIALVIIGFLGYKYISSALEPVDPESNDQIAVEIPMGSGITVISSVLEKKGIIKDAKIFKYYTKFKNESEFQAGNYSLTKSMTLDEIIESLKTGRVYREPVFTMTVPEGLTLDQIAKIVEKNTSISAEKFMEKTTNKAFIEQMMAEYPELLTEAILQENVRYALEGYLYPATYPFFEENPTIEEIVKTMLDATNSIVSDFKVVLEEKQMSVHELLTFASLLEEEATAQTDRETIASVFFNRIAIDMPLQTDPTVLYALGSHKERVLYEDLEVQNPYNTYQNVGLPPGPIAGAGKVSIEAALNPSQTDYLYFLADKEGTNHFAKSYDEHLANIEKYLK